MAEPTDIQRELQRRQQAAPAPAPTAAPASAPTTAAPAADREALIQQIRARSGGMFGAVSRGVQDINQGLFSAVGLGQSPLLARYGVIPEQPREGGVPAALRNVGAGLGFTAATVLPFLRPAGAAVQAASTAARGLPAVGQAVRGSLQTIANTAAREPVRFLATEATLNAAAGLGGEAAAREFPNQPLARAAGELAGGVAGSGAMTVTGAVARTAGRLSHISPVATATRGTVRALRSGIRDVRGLPPRPSPPGDTPGMIRAAQRVTRAVDDPEAVLRAADAADILPEARGRMTIGERAEDAGLLELERAVTESTERLSRANQERFADVNQMIRDSLSAPPGAADATPAQMRAYLDDLMNTDLSIAAARAQERIDQLGPTVPRENVNRIAREEVERAYQAAKRQENELWEAIPRDQQVPVSTTAQTVRARIERAQANRLAADKHGGVPALAQRWIGRRDPETGEWIQGELGDVATIDELKRLRTDLRRQADKERSRPAPDRERLAAIAEIDDAILQDMAQAFPDRNSPFDLARAFSRDLNDRFRRGDVGRMLGYTEIGEERILPGMTLEATVGRQGAMARESTDALLRAVERSGDLPAMRTHIENFLADEFQRVATRAGDFDPAAASAYLTRRQDVLARFPELRRKMQAAVQGRQAVIDIQRRTDPAVSAAAVVLNAPPGQEMQRLVAARNPTAAVRETLDLLRRDPTGRAVQGAQKAFTEMLLDRASPPGQLDVRDVPLVSGSRLRAQMLDPRVTAVAKELLTPEQMRRLEQARNTALRMERSRRAPPSAEGIIGDTTGQVSSLLGDILFNKAGLFVARATGTGPLQIPARFTQFGRELRSRGIDPARKLLVDAVTAQDDTLMRAIMTAPTARPQQIRQARQRLNSWALEGAREYGIALTEPEEPPP